MNIILYGFKSSGKTTVGQLIAKQLNMHFIDVDRLIEKRYGEKKCVNFGVREIYETEGDKYFRELEKDVIFSLNNVRNAVIATGGGSVLNSDNVVMLKQIGKLIYLKTARETTKIRLQDSHPAFIDDKDFAGSFAAMYASREPIYISIANIVIDTNGKTVTVIANEIIKNYLEK
jgi:shikimate kinase